MKKKGKNVEKQEPIFMKGNVIIFSSYQELVCILFFDQYRYQILNIDDKLY